MRDELLALTHDLVFKEGAPRPTIESVASSLGVQFPDDYVEFMLHSNGAEGTVGQAYIDLWSIEDLVPRNEGYQTSEFAPGLIIFGSDGGDTAFAFDKRRRIAAIVEVPFIGMSLSEAKQRGSTFVEFLETLSSGT